MVAQGQSARRVTALDVARAAGVSRTTVSYVLNETPITSIPAETRARVLEAASRLDYSPSAAARTLANGRSSLVLGLVPDWPMGPHLGVRLRRFTAAFEERGLAFLTHTATGPETDLAPLWKAVSPVAVGVLDDIHPDQLTRMRAAGIAVVVAWSAGRERSRGGGGGGTRCGAAVLRCCGPLTERLAGGTLGQSPCGRSHRTDIPPLVRLGPAAEVTMPDDDNLTAEELAELSNPVIEDEDFDIELAPLDSPDDGTDMADEDVEDDSGFLEQVVEDGDPVLDMAEGTPVGTGEPA